MPVTPFISFLHILDAGYLWNLRLWHKFGMEKAFHIQDFLILLKKHIKVFVGVFAALLVISFLIFFFKVPYVAKGRLFVNDSQNSSLQAFSTSYFGMTKSVADGKKGNTQIGKQVEMLRTREFYEKLVDRIHERGQSHALLLEEQQAYQKIKERYLDVALEDSHSRQSFIAKLDAWSQAKLESDYEIKISFATPSKELSLFLVNTALELSSDFLRNREMQEITEVEKFILEQKLAVDKNIKDLTHELGQFQALPENFISMTSQEKMSEYLSDLMVRINEARLKISENNKDIAFLRAEAGNETGSSLYGVGGRIAALRLENKMLEGRQQELQRSVDQIGRQLKVLPVAVQVLNDKRKKAELEYAKYKELGETLAKVEAQKLSVKDRFEILEKARFDNTGPQVDLATMMFLSLVVSVVFGLTFVYIKYIWQPVPVVPKGIRDVTMFRENAADNDLPVVFENAKLKIQPARDKAMDSFL